MTLFYLYVILVSKPMIMQDQYIPNEREIEERVDTVLENVGNSVIPEEDKISADHIGLVLGIVS